MMNGTRARRTITAVVVAAFAVGGAALFGGAASPAPASGAAEATAEAGGTDQRFVPNVNDAFRDLSSRADALGFRRNGVPGDSVCKHYQGLARNDADDGTPYMFLTKSGNVPFPCVGFTEDGYLIVIRMGSRTKSGERLRRNIYPYDSLSFLGEPAESSIPSADRGILAIPLNYRHPGGMQIVDDVLVIGAEEPVSSSDSRAALLFFDISSPESPSFIRQWDPPDLDGVANWDFGADPVGLTAIKTEDGKCCRYVMVVAGGPGQIVVPDTNPPIVVSGTGNGEVRFFRSQGNNSDGTTNLTDSALEWDEVGRFSEAQIESCDDPYDFDWPSGVPTQHQMLNFVREGSLDGRLFLVGGWRDGTVANPLSDENEFIDLFEIHLTPSGAPRSTCPISFVNQHRVGLAGTGIGDAGAALQSWGNHIDVGSFAAGSSAYVSPTGELIVYVSDHGDPVFGEYRQRTLVRSGSPTLRPTAEVGGPFVVDEGSSTSLTGAASAPITKAWVQLFEDPGGGLQHTDNARLNVEYDDRTRDQFGYLCKLNLANNSVFDPCGIVAPDPLWDRVTSLRWFAPPGCNIQVSDYPTTSDDFPNRALILRGTGEFELANNLGSVVVHRPASGSTPPWPVAPPPPGSSSESYDIDNDIEGVTFYEAYRSGGSLARVNRCDTYYDVLYTLGWDLDANGSFEATGSSVTFSAASLDGPSIATRNARATHPTDGSTVGSGVPIAVPIEVRNVAPTIAAASVKDTLGYDLDGGATKALVGLPVKLALRFTDPGRPDTHSAAAAWGDGSTSSASFPNALNGAVGVFERSHAYASPGTYTITVTVTDDDGGAVSTQFTVEVLSLEDAIKEVAEELRTRIDNAANPRVAAALRSALYELLGNRATTPPTNGALDKLDDDDPVSAITKLRAAISYLQTAEARGAGDLTHLKDLLGLVAEAIATGAYQQALDAIPAPSPGQARALASIESLISTGHQQLATGQYLKAFDSFRQAVQKSLDLTK